MNDFDRIFYSLTLVPEYRQRTSSLDESSWKIMFECEYRFGNETADNATAVI